MKFELIGKTKATLVDVDIQSLKKGQTDVVPAVALLFKVPLSNHSLNMLNATLRPFLFEKANPNSTKQATLDGVDVISDMPSLTDAASKLGTLTWDDEQTGSKLVIYQGMTGDADIRLKDGTVTIKKLVPHEGGPVDFFVLFYTADLNAETLGELAVLKSHDMDIELTAAEVVKAQKEMKLAPPKAEAQAAGDDNPFPIKGDESTSGTPESPFTPEQALANAVGSGAAAPAPKVITKRPSRLAAVAK